MKAREILLFYSMIYNGDWKAINQQLHEHSDEDPDEKEMKKVIKGVKSNYITCLDEEYPESLKQSKMPPFVLYYHGDISLLKKEPMLGVVGTRKCSPYGIEQTEKLVGELSNDFVIVSGMALGIDACAHRTAIKSGGRTIAVLGCGINLCYLDKNLDIYENCKTKNLVISEFPDMVQPSTTTFPIRNRIIVGLSDVLLIPEGKMNSGTQVSAFLMAEKNGNVCCVPTRNGEDSLCNHLISSGAYITETANDVYEVAHVRPKRSIFEK